MRVSEIMTAWRTILTGRQPALSIEITRECPLRCPGCYAYEDNHLGGEVTLRDLNDFKGDELVEGVFELVDRMKPLHVSLVGGDPLVRYRELESILPGLIDRGIHVQLVTSAFRIIPAHWAKLPRLNVVVSIDGLQEDHDVRRTPATYARIIKNIADAKITVHCTITGQMMKRRGYIEEFTEFWSGRPETRRLWFSIFTPQRGAAAPEILNPAERDQVISELLRLRRKFPKIDMPEGMIKEFADPPHSPGDCVFAMTTHTVSADLRTKISPCQLGGDPDCAQCGCIASMGLAAIGNYRLAGLLPVQKIFKASVWAGNTFGNAPAPAPEPAFRVLR